MRERPILFSGPKVRAIRDGWKTQTRRVAMHTVCGVRVARLAYDPAPDVRACPYGAPGDLLWVRETHYVESSGYVDGSGRRILYRADGEAPVNWTPSIHMPRWASRLTLRITDVRVERLQEISADDCRSEWHPTDWSRSPAPEVHDDAARDWYRDLWDSLNAARGYGWDANPWVWVVEFERLDCADDCPPGHCACHDGDARTANRTHTADAAGEEG